jgi:hypothetical protein
MLHQTVVTVNKYQKIRCFCNFNRKEQNDEKENEHGILGREGKALVHCGAEERHPQTVLQQQLPH